MKTAVLAVLAVLVAGLSVALALALARSPSPAPLPQSGTASARHVRLADPSLTAAQVSGICEAVTGEQP